MTDQARITDDLEQLLAVLPDEIAAAIRATGRAEALLEIVLDLGRWPEARYPDGFTYLREVPVAAEDLAAVVARLGAFSGDNRAGIERTLHRISALRNRQGEIVGLTCRVGRAVYGTIEVIRDLVEAGQSLLLLGRPGVGKTTMLREIARVLSDEFGKRVVIVDTSNEIAGDGDIPHPGIGRARRMQVGAPERQHAVMIEAVENHMPEVIIVDEIGTEREALAARTIAERGVQLVATAHGNALENLMQNPTLADLVGGIQAVTLGDEEARRRRTQKTVLERKAPPTFASLVEIRDKNTFAIHTDLAAVVDRILRGEAPAPEIRTRDAAGQPVILQAADLGPEEDEDEDDGEDETWTVEPTSLPSGRALKVFPYAVSRDKLEKAVRHLQVPVETVRYLDDADIFLTVKAQQRKAPERLAAAAQQKIPVYVVRGNSVSSIEQLLRRLFAGGGREDGDDPLVAAERAVETVRTEKVPVELPPQNATVRRLQHQVAEKHRLRTRSIGREPNRRVVIYPD